MKMKDKNMNQKKLSDNFSEKIKEYFSLIKPGLEKKKCLFKDGLHNLSTHQLHFLTNPSDDGNGLIAMLSIMIQAYPKHEIECSDEQMYDWYRILHLLLCSVELERHDLIKVTYGYNKLYPDKLVKIEMTEKSIAIKEKFGDDAINHLDD